MVEWVSTYTYPGFHRIHLDSQPLRHRASSLRHRSAGHDTETPPHHTEWVLMEREGGWRGGGRDREREERCFMKNEMDGMSLPNKTQVNYE